MCTESSWIFNEHVLRPSLRKCLQPEKQCFLLEETKNVFRVIKFKSRLDKNWVRSLKWRVTIHPGSNMEAVVNVDVTLLKLKCSGFIFRMLFCLLSSTQRNFSPSTRVSPPPLWSCTRPPPPAPPRTAAQRGPTPPWCPTSGSPVPTTTWPRGLQVNSSPARSVVAIFCLAVCVNVTHPPAEIVTQLQPRRLCVTAWWRSVWQPNRSESPSWIQALSVYWWWWSNYYYYYYYY